MLDQKGQKLLDRNFEPGFRLALHHKVFGIVTAAAREAGVIILVGAIVVQLFAEMTSSSLEKAVSTNKRFLGRHLSVSPE